MALIELVKLFVRQNVLNVILLRLRAVIFSIYMPAPKCEFYRSILLTINLKHIKFIFQYYSKNMYFRGLIVNT